MRVPKGTTGLQDGTRAGATCDQPVNLLSLYPTLIELAGLPAKVDNDGPSLVPLLKDPPTAWPHASVTFLGEPGSFGLSTKDLRLIQYANGDAELYDIKQDPHEWRNLAGRPERQADLQRLRAMSPTEFVELIREK